MQFFHVSITFVAQELVAPAQIEKSGFFLSYMFSDRLMRKTLMLLTIMLKNGQIHFFFNLTWSHEFLGHESDRYVKKLHFFSIFRNYNFWSILTTFDPVFE